MSRRSRKKRPAAPSLIQQTRESLEFPIILRFFASRAQTEVGKDRVLDLSLSAREDLVEHFNLLDQWLVWVSDYNALRFPEIPPPELFRRNPHVDPFDAPLLRGVRDFLLFRRLLRQRDDLAFAVTELPPDTPLEILTDRLDALFQPDGDWRDDISPLYARLIRKHRATKERIDQTMANLLRRHGDNLNEAIVFQRNNRRVLAVKQNFRGRVSGILQDYSASGNTVYIEPETTTSDQNALTQIRAEIEEELWRIRCEITEQIIQHDHLADHIVPIIADMDMMQALALVARETRSIVVCPNQKREFHLIQARHPFLDEGYAQLRQRVFELEEPDTNKMIAFSLNLDADLRGLVISGANTGGKTVTLKTVGLMAWMANSGLPVPVEDGSNIPWYHTIFADIGDHQSLSHNLSTYASHLANMRAVFEHQGDDLLILLDELGSGTDPTEGNALAQAMIETIVDRGSHLLVTTHQQILCTLALNHPHLDNGSMVFDPKRLKPTFRFNQGVPGRSHALETAFNSGLPQYLLDRAKTLIDEDQVDIREAILKLQEQHKHLRKQQQKLRKEELRMHRRIGEARQEADKLKKQQEEQKQKAKERLSREVDKANKELRTLLTDIESTKQKRGALAKFAGKKNQIMESVGGPIKREDINVETTDVPIEDWKPGDRVFLKSWLKEGTLQGIDRKKARVDLNGMAITVKVTDLMHVVKKAGPKPKISEEVEGGGEENLSIEVRLLGKRVDDALLELEHQIDLALRRGAPFLKVIHGHGSGALKSAVRKFLQKHDARNAFTIELDKHNDGVTDIKFEE